ncbi:hypothetical protein BDQ94DRAFT_152636 [Aspergillus welwitschiae]|uniref:Uncharacterized protein n=1 Tax=Aspergillus welwitschiae TaxID=1341132 RepID=A0A3F3PMS8_9EURO|nr:hypothetical protein BDQ94DRAFT_152636 [Aspergillus welwitschiae]RDH28143.1 hypothetical protein BDQ94DRAFT_152636 [Aspergillus welwitschiae]
MFHIHAIIHRRLSYSITSKWGMVGVTFLCRAWVSGLPRTDKLAGGEHAFSL